MRKKHIGCVLTITASSLMGFEEVTTETVEFLRAASKWSPPL
jgi:hypothetical protein